MLSQTSKASKKVLTNTYHRYGGKVFGSQLNTSLLSCEYSSFAKNTSSMMNFSMNNLQISNNFLQTRSFSSKEIAKVLADEIVAEQAEKMPIDEDYEAVKKTIESKFKIVDEAGVAEVKLIKLSGKEKITIAFDCSDKEETQPEFDEEFDENKEYNDEDFEGDMGIPFQVEIEKNGNKVIVDMVAAETMEVRNVNYQPAGKDVDDDKLYGGPVFDDLDEQLREGLFDYLDDLGINDDMNYFILNYAPIKEQKEYEGWLKAMQKFTSS